MYKLYRTSALMAILLLLGSCKKYLDINSNPVTPQVPMAESLLAPIIFQMTNGTSQDYRVVFKITQNMVGISTNINSLSWEQHGFPPASDVGGVIWRMNYVDLGLNLENMINDGIANQKYEYVGIGYAIKAWAYQMTTDLHGPIILDEAYNPELLSFPYQDQPDVYARVREWGQLAIKYLDMKSPVDYTAKLASESGDNIYRGDKEKWKKFVYGLFALQYSHLVKKPEFKTAYADSVIKYTNLSFANTSEDATVFFAASNSEDSNPYGVQMGYLPGTVNYYARPTTTIVEYLTGGVRGEAIPDSKTSVDPRLGRMLSARLSDSVYVGAIPTQGDESTGVPLVLGHLTSGTTGTYNGKYIFADAARYPLMTYSQLQFTKAEALFIQDKKAEAYLAYTKGIREHMTFYNQYGRAGNAPDPIITETEISAYMKSSEVAQGPEELTLADIMGQKYIAQWGWAGIEQWCDLRKYHYDPNVFRTYHQLTEGELALGSYAYRFRPRYNSEYIWNATELDKWGGLNPDYMTKETWFSLP